MVYQSNRRIALARVLAADADLFAWVGIFLLLQTAVVLFLGHIRDARMAPYDGAEVLGGSVVAAIVVLGLILRSRAQLRSRIMRVMPAPGSPAPGSWMSVDDVAHALAASGKDYRLPDVRCALVALQKESRLLERQKAGKTYYAPSFVYAGASR